MAEDSQMMMEDSQMDFPDSQETLQLGDNADDQKANHADDQKVDNADDQKADNADDQKVDNADARAPAVGQSSAPRSEYVKWAEGALTRAALRFYSLQSHGI